MIVPMQAKTPIVLLWPVDGRVEIDYPTEVKYQSQPKSKLFPKTR